MANPFLEKLNNRELMDAFGVSQENAPLTPEELAALSEQQAVQQPEPMAEIPAEPVVKAATAAPKKDQPKAPAQDDLPKPPAGDTPLSKSEALIAEYNKMLGRDQEALAEARKSDRMLKVGGALGDALATYLNAKSQMNVKAPGVQVQQGVGLDKVAEMFATAPGIQSDIAARRENLMKQYGELAKGERAQARLTSEEKRADMADKRARELAQMQIEGELKAAGIKASGKGEFTPYQEKMLGEKQEDKVRKLGSDVTKSGLPRLTKSIKELENQLGMPLEIALERNTDEDKENDVNIPGYGRLASLAPDWSVKQDSRAFRQGVQSVLNPDISKQYGATQSTGEIERYQKQIGGGTFEDQNAVLRGLTAIKGAAKADLEAITAGYKPEIVQTYQARKGVSLDTVKKEGVFPKTVTNKKTKETAIVEDEQELKEALAEGFE